MKTNNLRAKAIVFPVAASLVATILVTRAQSGSHRTYFGSVALASSRGGECPYPPVKPRDEGRLGKARAAGLHGDRSRISDILSILDNPQPFEKAKEGESLLHPIYVMTALHAAAQLGATEALPAIDAIVQKDDQTISPYARAAKARLLAEDSTKGIGNYAARAIAKIQRLYAEMGLSPTDLNTGLVVYQAPPQPDASGRLYVSTQLRPVPVEVYAMREIADMVYQGAYADYVSLPGVIGVNFQNDYPSALKMRLASLPPNRRTDTLLQELAGGRIPANDEQYAMQLVLDAGPAASAAIGAKLREMDTHKPEYPEQGFTALLSLLGTINDKSQASLIQHFRQEDEQDRARRDVRKVYVANSVYLEAEAGIKRQYAPGY